MKNKLEKLNTFLHNKRTRRYLLVALPLAVTTNTYAIDSPIDDEISIEMNHMNNNVADSSVSPKEKLPETLAVETSTETTTELMDKKQKSIEHLKNNSQDFEKLLSILLKSANSEALKELLPIYESSIEGYDPSLVDWGQAIIKAKSGKLDEAIVDYRKLNSLFPNVRVIRFQMAMALFHNQQYQASKSEFESLRSVAKSKADISAIEQYLDAISRKDDWSFSINGSYISDKNLTNAPPIGTRIEAEDGSVLEYNSPHESGNGINYSVSADKKWLDDNHTFVSVNTGAYGKYYWNNTNFNDVTATVGVGVGYQSATTQFEVGPYFNKRWYAGGTSGKNGLENYSDTIGVKVNASQRVTPKIRLSASARVNDSHHERKYAHNNGSNVLGSVSALYNMNQYQSFTTSLNHSVKNATALDSSYSKNGIKLGWRKTWMKGFSSNLSLGYAQTNYDDVDFSNIKRENDEYDATLSVWNRKLSLFTLTPRLNLKYSQVKSNSALEEYKKPSFSVELTKSF